VLAEVGLEIAVPPGPVHAKVVAPVERPVSVKLLPTHKGLGVAVALTPVGVVTILTAAEVAVIVGQPAVLAVNVYTPALPATTPVTLVLNDVGLPIAVPPGPVQA
jgi:hypothetical protein